MLRESMVECAALVGQARALCSVGHGDKATELLDDALILLSECPDSEREGARDRKRNQRAREKEERDRDASRVTERDTVTRHGDSEEAEGVVAVAGEEGMEEVADPRPNGRHARAVLDYFNEVAGTRYNSKVYLASIAARLREDAETKRPDGRGATAEQVVENAECVIDEKKRQTKTLNGRGEPCFDPAYFNPETLFRPSKYPKYLEEARARTGGRA